MKLQAITPRFVEFIPKTLEDGMLYIAEEYETATHRCCCGCGSKIVISLRPTDHQLIKNGLGQVSISPSIGNWDYPCQSHYWIKKNQVLWSGPMTREQILQGFQLDEARRKTHFEQMAANRRWWVRIGNKIVAIMRVLFKKW